MVKGEAFKPKNTNLWIMLKSQAFARRPANLNQTLPRLMDAKSIWLDCNLIRDI